jgi:tetratricopeptide (TPR) repeat protein
MYELTKELESNLEKGRDLLDKQEYEAAIRTFLKAVQDDPGSGEAWYNLARALDATGLKRGDSSLHENATEAYNKAKSLGWRSEEDETDNSDESSSAPSESAHDCHRLYEAGIITEDEYLYYKQNNILCP